MLPDSWGPFAGETLALIDSKNVQARTYGMADENFRAWVQKAQTFNQAGTPGTTRQIIPAEWNYYGGMDMKMVAAQVIGVTSSLNSEQEVAENAQAILQTTERSLWMSTHYMPRTRDMSASRLKLLRAWCLKVS